jgi:hypothetical protein
VKREQRENKERAKREQRENRAVIERLDNSRRKC